MRIAYQGEPGAFSHEACRRFVSQAEAAPYPSFDAAVDAVVSGACDAALLPVANSLAGPVEPVVSLMATASLRELDRFELPVRMMLIGSPGSAEADLRVVASHPVALKQCRRLIAELRLMEEVVFDTAGAARLLAERPDRSRAALASRAAAELHGLPVLRADVQDRLDNHTTFLLLKP